MLSVIGILLWNYHTKIFSKTFSKLFTRSLFFLLFMVLIFYLLLFLFWVKLSYLWDFLFDDYLLCHLLWRDFDFCFKKSFKILFLLFFFFFIKPWYPVRLWVQYLSGHNKPRLHEQSEICSVDSPTVRKQGNSDDKSEHSLCTVPASFFIQLNKQFLKPAFPLWVKHSCLQQATSRPGC